MQALAEPAEAAIGDTVLLKTQFSGDRDDLKEVYITLREYAYDYQN